MTLKIETLSDGECTTVRLVGRMQAEHLGELGLQIQLSHVRVVLDLTDVTLVDREAVHFLSVCESRGIEVVNCSQYIREWIAREHDPSG